MILAPVIVRCPSNGRSASSTSGLLAPAAQSSAGHVACSCLLSPAVLPQRPHHPDTTPTASQAIPPLTHSPCYSAATAASHHSELVNSRTPSTRGHPLPRLPRLRVVPFLVLAVVHRRGALGTAWSMWSTTDFHRKSTVRGEADSWIQAAARKCLLITRKIIIPPPDCRDPSDGPPYFAKKTFPP